MKTPGNRLSFRFARIVGHLRRFRTETAGAVAVIVAVMAPVLIGGMGLGSEAGYWYLTQRKVQSGADVGAHGAAGRLAAGDGAAAMQDMAEYLVGQAEIDLEDASVTVNNPPTSGSYAGIDDAVEVIVVETVPRLFTGIYTMDPVPITGRAVAVGDGGAAGCVVALSSTVQNALTISGSATVSLTGCDMVSNAAGQSLYMEGTTSVVSTRCTQTVGTAFVRPNLNTDCAVLRENADALADPYASVPEPDLTGTCSDGAIGNNKTATQVTASEAHASGMLSKRFCNGLTLSGTVDFAPGLYMIEGGPFRIAANSKITGDGVVFYLSDGVAMDFAGSASIDISAPTTGVYAGIVIFGSRSATAVTHIISGDSHTSFDGAIYTPLSRIEYTGSSTTATNGCTQLIGDTVQIRGSGSISLSCAKTAGDPAHNGTYVRLVE